MRQSGRGGFTLVELLVVIGIIAAILIMITPSLQKTIVRGKDQAVRSNCAAIEAALSTFALRNGGAYPGLALDLGTPDVAQVSEGSGGMPRHVLGDPILVNPNPIAGGGFVGQGVIGGVGRRTAGTGPATQQIDVLRGMMQRFHNPGDGAAKGQGWWDANIGTTDRYFDVLMASDALTAQNYPNNAYKQGMLGSTGQMRNIFLSRMNRENFTDLSVTSWVDNETAWINTQAHGSNHAGLVLDGYDNSYQLQHMQLADPAVSQERIFGCGPVINTAGAVDITRQRYFSEGDFAYVPILSTSVDGLYDDPETLADERYHWGGRVTAYMLFGYGSRNGKNDLFVNQQRAFAEAGLPGYGDLGIDTPTELVVYHLFEGAIYYSAAGLDGANQAPSS